MWAPSRGNRAASLQEWEWKGSRVPFQGQMWMEGGDSCGRLDRRARPPLPTLARPRTWVSDPRPDRAQSQSSRQTWLACVAPPVVVVTGHCQGNQRGSHPARAEPGVALGNPVRWFPGSSLPTSGSGPGEGQGKSRHQRDSCGGLGRRRRPFKNGSRSWNALPARVLCRG